MMPANRAGLPKNTILDGHQRLRALLLNGESSTTVKVCYDLADVDADVVERVFIESNMLRQHKDDLLRARIALRLFELIKGGKLIRSYHGEARDYIGKIFGSSGRNISRYFRILRGPIPVQDAFRSKKIPLVLAEKVCELTACEQKQISTPSWLAWTPDLPSKLSYRRSRFTTTRPTTASCHLSSRSNTRATTLPTASTRSRRGSFGITPKLFFAPRH